ncbi:MAG: tetratricopeptide repeat protein [Ignavibacteriae bacterium]|nr:tetratricopeptide repeat protein [Ignavibacteriota bacterium]MCB9216854.1 tetratricopeptide repeat protein [Ignavibacteria bacterium]
MSQLNELRIFISSTFRDLGEEREHLVKKIFPEIRALCRTRGITFTEIDLRWGLTEEDVKLGQVIRACLEEVDKCRPYFIGITGSRYGYVPSYLDIQKDPTLLELYPWIEDAAVDGMSITEMEAHYAVLGAGTPEIDKEPTSEASFYFRENREKDVEFGDDAELSLLRAYQERIRSAGLPVESFSDPDTLGKLISEELTRIINRDFADATPPTPLEEERGRHQAFSLSRRRAYIANPLYLKRLNEHAKEDGPPLVVYAESGSGKSSLFAFWAEQFRRKNPQTTVIEHYVGIGATATDHYAIIQHICMEIKERFHREEDIPTTPDALERALGQWLGYAGHALRQSNERIVLILDGLNQLQGNALGLKWIPDVIPPEIRLILSSTVESTLVELKKRGWNQLGLQALSEAEREVVVVRYLAEYRKALSSEQIRQIASDYKCGHPLFLKTLLEEIRLISRHEDLQQWIDEYLSATGTEDLFQKVLERIEGDHGLRTVRDALSPLWCSRTGLDEGELSELSKHSLLKITAMTAGLDYHLVRKDARLTFFHDYLRRAVEKRYLSNSEAQVEQYRQLGSYFEQTAISLRTTLELLHALEGGNDREGLNRVLSQIARFVELWEAERYEVLRLWSNMNLPVIVAAYQTGLEVWESQHQTDENRAQALAAVGKLYNQIGAWGEAEQVFRRQLNVVRRQGDRKAEIAVHCLLADVTRAQGRIDESRTLSCEAERLARDLGDAQLIGFAVACLGIVHSNLGEYTEALSCFQQQEQIARELGDMSTVGTVVGNRGNVHTNLGEYAKAITCYREGEQIGRELGDLSMICTAVGYLANIYTNLGEYTEALPCYREQEEIARKLGNRRLIGVVLGNRGVMHAEQGEYAEALSNSAKALEIHQEIGFRYGAVYWHCGIGRFLLALYNDNESQVLQEFLGRNHTEASETGWQKATLEVARSHAQNCVEISRELSKPDTLFFGEILLAQISAAEGSTEEGVLHLKELLSNATTDDERSELHYWLWKLNASDDDHRQHALHFYETLFTRTPRKEYRERIEELIDQSDLPTEAPSPTTGEMTNAAE